jgi:hypothetical protein
VKGLTDLRYMYMTEKLINATKSKHTALYIVLQGTIHNSSLVKYIIIVENIFSFINSFVIKCDKTTAYRIVPNSILSCASIHCKRSFIDYLSTHNRCYLSYLQIAHYCTVLKACERMRVDML